MAKGWMGVALLALGSIVAPTAAQAPYLPDQGMQGPMADPVPCFNSPLPSIPTPPPSSQSSANWLPANVLNAWDQRMSPDPPALYMSFGYMALERQRLGHGAAAVLDTASGGVDTGNLPPAGAPEAADFHDVQQRFNHGVRATLGYHWAGQAIELSGFYLSQNSTSKTFANPGNLDSFFNVGGDFSRAPLGFEGDNDLWLQAEVPKIIASAAYTNNGLLLITWDEGGSNSDGPIGMIALSPRANSRAPSCWFVRLRTSGRERRACCTKSETFVGTSGGIGRSARR